MKRTILTTAFSLTLGLLSTSSIFSQQEAPFFQLWVLGDVNGDRIVSVPDAIRLQEYLLDIIPNLPCRLAADANADGTPRTVAHLRPANRDPDPAHTHAATISYTPTHQHPRTGCHRYARTTDQHPTAHLSTPADEPTPALDVTIQAQIVELVKQLQEKLGMAIVWITHDLGVVAGMVEKVAVMYAGYIVEMAEVHDLYANRNHPYTLGLLESLPKVDQRHHERLATIKGLPPDLLDEPTFCPFAPRCPYAIDKCWQENPPLLPSGPNHKTACWRWEEIRVDMRFGEKI